MGLEWIGINSKSRNSVMEVAQSFYSVAQVYIAMQNLTEKLC